VPNTVCAAKQRKRPPANATDCLAFYQGRPLEISLTGVIVFNGTICAVNKSGSGRCSALQRPSACCRSNFAMQIIWLQAMRCSTRRMQEIVCAEPEFGQTGTDKSLRGAGETVIFYTPSCTQKIQGSHWKLLWDKNHQKQEALSLQFTSIILGRKLVHFS
jgi:hypothetical protein